MLFRLPTTYVTRHAKVGPGQRTRRSPLILLGRLCRRAAVFSICAGILPGSHVLALDSRAPTVLVPASKDVSADGGAGALPDAPGWQPEAPAAQPAATEKGLPVAVLKDQVPIWTSPVRVRTHDLIWLLPFGAATGVTLATDTDAMRDLSRDRTFNKDNVNASNYLLGGAIAVPVGLYGVGVFKGNAHARETGLLSGEALADSVVVEEVAKLVFRRQRPLDNNAAGDFFAANIGGNSSFPSSHSTLAWTVAAVVSGEYPSKWAQLSVYSFASAVSVTRVLGQEHFPSDVFVGAVAGWLIGHYVFEKHQPHHRTKAPPSKTFSSCLQSWSLNSR
jgi:membrane-associated phospholipid phosphatase